MERNMVTSREPKKCVAVLSGTPCDFLLSGFTEKQKSELCKKLQSLGGRCHNEPDYIRCTHIICIKPMRSEKFLCGVASGKWILKPEFVKACVAKGQWQPESLFEWGAGAPSSLCPGDVPMGLLMAPMRWRKKVASSKRGAFHGWRVLILVENIKNRPGVYRRVIETGGGKCLPLKLPIQDPDSLASHLTHVIVDKSYEADVQCLEKRGVPCLMPEFIAEHLFEEEPNLEKYRVSTFEMTPSQPQKQRNVVVASVNVKKNPEKTQGTFTMDDFLWPRRQLRSREVTSSSTTKERETPGSATTTMTPGGLEEDKSPRSGVKRKLHFSPNQLREALQILKKRKVASQHLPLVPYTMAIPRQTKKTFQCASDECTSSPFHSNLGNFVDAVLESQFLEALYCIGSSISTKFYPPPDVLNTIMKQVLKSPSLKVCRSAVHILKQVLCLHSPACHPSLRKLYLQAMAPPRKFGGQAYHNEHWRFLECVIRRALDGRPVVDGTEAPKDEEASKVAMETAEMLLHFLVALMEEDFMASVRGSEDAGRCSQGQSILGQVLWPSSLEQASRKVPINGHQLMAIFVDAVKMAAKCDDWVPVTNLIATLIMMSAEISSYLGQSTTPKNPEKGRGEARKEFAERLALTAKNDGIQDSRVCQELFLSMLRPSWLCQGVSECLLQSYNDQLLGEDAGFWANQPLSLRKIVRYYFYLVPHVHLAGAPKKDSAGESKGSPLKTIGNQQTVASPKTKRTTNVNRKNAKGETPLHQACIKNDVAKVRELLKAPGINVNARDNAGWTPLHEACNHGNTGCVQELLRFLPGRQLVSGLLNNNSKLELDLLATPPCGTTALHDAVVNDHVGVAKLLVEAGGNGLLSVKNEDGKTPLDYAATDTMKTVLQGRLPLTGKSGSEKENQPAQDGRLSPEIRSPQPDPSRYHQLLGPPATNDTGYVTNEECEKFTSIVMGMLQSYIRSHDLHRVKAEVDIIKGQRRIVNKLQMNGAPVTISETTPFVSVVGAPTLSKASRPPTPDHQDPVYTDTGPSVDALLEDMETFVELSRHTEGLKAHLRQIGAPENSTVATKPTACTRVSRSMRYITHLCSVLC